ncbi:MAG: exodeoxyribonuclease VII large subunit [Rickettsiales bacterium]
MPSPSVTHNIQEYTVSEISGAVKRVVEDTFGYVRVRGEISGFKRPASGHLYFDLKDANSVLSSVCWRGTASKLGMAPEDGMEVIATGKLSTYAGTKSTYQLIVDRMEVAGAGALMALLEKRKQQFLAEGLFDPARKKALPFLPKTIGVVTSPTGAVIRDILHRLSDRFPLHVIVWPVRVQGECASDEIAAAINGFSTMDSPNRPDLIIVARGGGSMEDLWCFNEEIVVRAVAACTIPLISAVGHETDTTLIDYVADRRAPTPTAAAEMAVPVREELLLYTQETEIRLGRSVQRFLAHEHEKLRGLVRGLPRLDSLLATVNQRLDEWSERLTHAALPGLLKNKMHALNILASRLSPLMLSQPIRRQQEILAQYDARLQKAAFHHHERLQNYFSAAAQRLAPQILSQPIKRRQEALDQIAARQSKSFTYRLETLSLRLEASARLLESLSYTGTLKRGFALVVAPDGHPVTSKTTLEKYKEATLRFHDGEKRITVS